MFVGFAAEQGRYTTPLTGSYYFVLPCRRSSRSQATASRADAARGEAVHPHGAFARAPAAASIECVNCTYRERTVMLTSELRTTVVTLAAIGALTMSAAGASAAPVTKTAGTGTYSVKTVSSISAFPADPSNKYQRQTCLQWTNRLQADQGFTLQVGGNASTPQSNPQLEADASAAMDAGCVVIY
jgi:hypothetical protein